MAQPHRITYKVSKTTVQAQAEIEIYDIPDEQSSLVTLQAAHTDTLEHIIRVLDEAGLIARMTKPVDVELSTEADSGVMVERAIQRAMEYLPDSKINAIKAVREVTGWGLKESRDFVDSLQDNRDLSFTHDPETRKRTIAKTRYPYLRPTGITTQGSV